MISLRKHIENYRAEKEKKQPEESLPPVAEPHVSDSGVPEPVAAEFRAMLLAIGENAGRAVPNVGSELTQKMAAFQKSLTSPVTPVLLSATNQSAQSELSRWADSAFTQHQTIQRELREILAAVSSATESVCKRDEKFAKEIGALTGRLGAIAEESNLALLRASLVDCTKSLKTCVAKMAEESKASVNQLTSQVREYRVRFEEAERESLTDALTNLANRRSFEKHLETRIGAGKTFCLIMIDLDEFKGVNDSFGHIAGDDLLKQFADELKSQFTGTELVCRLGGDEFIVVVAGSADEAGARVDRIRKWALGEYKINAGDRQVKTHLQASIGVSEWDGRESGVALLGRADKEVYRAKQPGSRARRANSETERRAMPAPAKEAADFSHVIR